ncbi:putative ribonuclease H-like domain-containing protein [Tanacetum coccineum]
MDLETAQTNTTAKLPHLKQGEYDMFVTADENIQKKNNVKVRSMLLMALPNEHLLTFNQYKDAKTLFVAIQTRFGGNDVTKKKSKDISEANNVAFMSSSSSTNKVNTTYGVSTANTQVSLASTQVRTASTQKTGRKITINGSDTARYDKSKVECFNCHKLGHFSRECRGPRNQDNRSRNQDNSRRTINVEEISSKAMLAIDGAGFDWSFMADEEVPTDMALMAFSDLHPEKNLFQQPPEFEGYGPKTSKSVNEDTSNEVRKSPDAPLVEELVSNDKLEKKTGFPTVAKIIFVRPQKQEKTVRKPVKYAEMYRSQTPRGNQRNWNNQKSQQLGSDFVMYNKACFVCGSFDHGHPQKEDQGYVDSEFSRHMTGNMSYLSDFKKFDGGYVTFGGGAKGGRITGKGTLKTSKLDFKDVYFVKELQFNLFSVSQMCDKKNSVLFTDTGCFVLSPDFKLADESQNRVLVVKPYNKTPYELFRGKTHSLSFMRPFGCHVTILNTLDHLGKFDGKSDDGFFVGYSLNSKAFRVYNIRTRKVEENLHVRFLEDKPIIAGDGPKWLFDIDVLTKSMNYVPVVTCTNSNDFVGTKESIGAGHSSKEPGSSQDYILMPLDAGKKDDDGGIDNQEGPKNSYQDVNTDRPSINTSSTNINTGSLNINTVSPSVTTAPLEATHADFFGDETKLDMSNITNTYLVPTTPSTRILKDQSLDHVIGNVQSVEPKKVIQALTYSSSIEAMLDELLQFKLQKVWTLVDLPYGKRVIGTKWVIEAIRLFLAYASFKDFVVYQMDVKSAFLYGKIEEEVYVCQPLGFEDPEFTDKVYKEEKALYGLHQAPRAWTKDEDVDVHLYRLMIGSLMYLTASKPDIMFVDSPFDLEAYTDSDYAGASLDRKSIIGGYQFLGRRLISWQCKKQTIVANSTTDTESIYSQKHLMLEDFEYLIASIGMLNPLTANDEIQVSTIGLPFYWYALTKNPTIYVSLIKKFWQTVSVRTVDNGEQEITSTVDGKEFIVTEVFVRRHLQLADVDGISILPTTGIGASGSPRCQEAMGGSIAQTRSERVPTPPYDLPLLRVYTLGSDEGSMTLQELMVLCTTLSKKVESLEADLKQTKQVYGAAYTKLIRKVKKGEDQPEDQLGVLSATKVLADAAKTNVHTYTRRRAVSTGSGGIGTIGASMPVSTSSGGISTAGASMLVCTAGMVQEVNINIPSPVVVKDKGKGKMKESKDEQTKRTKLQQEQERLDHEAAEEWENIRARVEADEELSKRLQAKERNKYNEVDQAKMLVDLINQRKKYFPAQKAEAKRNKPMTQAQQRNYMINYIKHMGSHTLQQLKIYSFYELKELFETKIKNVNTFVPMETEDKERASELEIGSSQVIIIDSAKVGSSKRAAEAELDHEGSKRQKTNEASGSVQEQPEEEEKELSQEDLQQMMMVVPVEEVYVEALQVKYPIIDWEVYTEESRKYWKIIRVGNHTEAYQFFEDMLKIFDRDDLVMLWNLVKERFSSTEPTDDKERTLWVELKRFVILFVLFKGCYVNVLEHHALSEIVVEVPNVEDIGGLENVKRVLHEEYWWCTKRALDRGPSGGPHLIIDDGGDATLLIHKGVKAEEEFAKIRKYLNMKERLVSVSKETTTEVKRLYQMQAICYGGKVCGEGECKSQDYTAAQSYYLQPASLWPASGNPHHQFAILANYLGDDLLTVYRYFWSLGTEVDANDDMLSLHSVTLLTGRQEVAFSEGAHVNSVENTQDPHENAQGRSAAAEGPS